MQFHHFGCSGEVIPLQFHFFVLLQFWYQLKKLLWSSSGITSSQSCSHLAQIVFSRVRIRILKGAETPKGSNTEGTNDSTTLWVILMEISFETPLQTSKVSSFILREAIGDRTKKTPLAQHRKFWQVILLDHPQWKTSYHHCRWWSTWWDWTHLLGVLFSADYTTRWLPSVCQVTLRSLPYKSFSWWQAQQEGKRPCYLAQFAVAHNLHTSGNFSPQRYVACTPTPLLASWSRLAEKSEELAFRGRHFHLQEHCFDVCCHSNPALSEPKDDSHQILQIRSRH